MNRSELADHVLSHAEALRRSRVVTGFDGFIDEMISVVDQRLEIGEFRRVETIQHFADLAAKAAGQSSLREIVVNETNPGGCAVNLADGLAALGVHADVFATLGEPAHSAFAPLGQVAHLHPWGPPPGRTLAFEFHDGKLMYSHVSHLADFTPAYVEARLEEGVYQDCCRAAQLIALTDWTLYPHMTAVWRLLRERVFAQLPHRATVLVDLVDPSSRNDAEILAMLEELRELSAVTSVTLSVNQNEANVLAGLVGVGTNDRSAQSDVVGQAAALLDRLGVAELLLHTHRIAACVHAAGGASIAGPYCETPVKSTGAGDRFNAGYAAGVLLGLEVEDRLTLASAASGWFVRNAKSAGPNELAEILRSDAWP